MQLQRRNLYLGGTGFEFLTGRLFN